MDGLRLRENHLLNYMKMCLLCLSESLLTQMSVVHLMEETQNDLYLDLNRLQSNEFKLHEFKFYRSI